MNLFGFGLIKGLWVTLKNFVLSYLVPRGLNHSGVVTVQYPEERTKRPERFRYFPFLVYDKEPSRPRCTACGICAEECPPQCIMVVRDTDTSGKPARFPKVYDVDVSICMSCGICQEVCPFDAVFLDHEIEVSTTRDRRKALVYRKEQLLKSIEYMASIRPMEAATTKARKE